MDRKTVLISEVSSLQRHARVVHGVGKGVQFSSFHWCGIEGSTV